METIKDNIKIALLDILESRGINQKDILDIKTISVKADHSYYSDIGPGAKIHSSVNIKLNGNYEIYYLDDEVKKSIESHKNWIEENKNKIFWKKSKRPYLIEYKTTKIYVDDILEYIMLSNNYTKYTNNLC